MGTARVIYWFRTDLRLHDSPALQAALELNPAVLWPVFTWDPHYVYRARGGLNRWQHLLDCQNDLSASLTKLNPKSRLLVVREAPQTVFPKLFKAWGVTHLVFEKDTDAYARERDRVVCEAARHAGVEVVVRYGRTLWDSDDIVKANGNKPTMSITQLQSAGAKIGPVPKPQPAPKSIPDLGPTPLEGLETKKSTSSSAVDVNAKWRTAEGGKETAYAGPSVAGPKGDFAVETLAELGYPPATTPHKGGETLALASLERSVSADADAVRYAATFRKPQTSPAAVGSDSPSTTLLSPALHFGALSVRTFYWKAQEALDRYSKEKPKATDASKPPESLIGQLLFRDMYFAAQAAIGPKFTQAVGNAHCRILPWHLPSRLDSDGLITFEYDVDDPKAEQFFKRWEFGCTGFPWIDAQMRCMRETGWIHHLGRHSVACFLTRGGCYVHWERGAAVFEELLLDHEPACNAGNWQWLSCTAFFSQYFRMYSPVAFPKKWDKDGAFVRLWVPELAKLDARYIYEPWKAPLADQKKAGVRIAGDGNGQDEKADGVATYPKPMFDFDERRRFCLSAMKKAYDAGLYGDDKRVTDGSFDHLFDDGKDTATKEAKTEESDHDDDDDDDEDEDHHPKKKAKTRPSRVQSSKTPKNADARQATLDRHVKKEKKKT